MEVGRRVWPSLVVDPDNRLTVVSLSNTAVEGWAGKFAAELLEAVYHAAR